VPVESAAGTAHPLALLLTASCKRAGITTAAASDYAAPFARELDQEVP
jgi:hypothetical protein